MRKWRVGTLTLGVVFVFLGVLLLVGNINGTNASFDLIAKWWPVTLIMLGAEVLVYIYMAKEENTHVRFDGFSIFIIILVLIATSFGYTFKGAFRNGNFVMNGIHFGNNNYKYQTKCSFEKNVDPIKLTKLIVENDNGNIVIDKSNTKFIQVNAEICINNNDEAYAKKISKSIVEITKDSAVNIKSDTENYKYNQSKVSNISVDYTIKVPEGMSVDTNNLYGNTKIRNISKSVSVNSENGSVDVKGVGGTLDIHNTYGDSMVDSVTGKTVIKAENGKVIASNIKGSLEVKDTYGDTSVNTVGGSLTAKSENGSIDVEKVKGAVTLENVYGKTTVNDVKGKVESKAENGDVSITGIDSDVKVNNQYGNINVTGANKLIDLYCENGEVTINSDKVIEKGVKVDSQNGDVNLNVPSNQTGYFKVTAENGDIDTGLNLKVKDNEDDSQKSIDQRIGQGSAEFNISSNSGRVRINNR